MVTYISVHPDAHELYAPQSSAGCAISDNLISLGVYNVDITRNAVIPSLIRRDTWPAAFRVMQPAHMRQHRDGALYQSGRCMVVQALALLMTALTSFTASAGEAA